MQKYDGQLFQKFPTEENGIAAVGVTVTVRNYYNGNLAEIYSDEIGIQPKDNPLTTNEFGYYSFYAPNGRYNIFFGNGFPQIEIILSDHRAEVRLDDFKQYVVNDDWTNALWEAIKSLRKNPTTLLQWIGGPSITAYESGTVLLGRAVYKIKPGQLEIFQDLGLQIKGEGSRRTNKAIKAASTILIDGASSPTNYFGFKFFGNGARGCHLEDLDINYNSSDFTGDLIHAVQVPGFSSTRLRLGWHSSMLLTARSCLRTAFDEFNTHTDIVFDGANDLWLSDTITELNGPSDFGGSTHMLVNPVFYDAVNTYMKHDANRTRQGITLINPSFDVIDTPIVRAVDLENVDGFNWLGGICASSGLVVATNEWIRLRNVTGCLHGIMLNDLVKAGTLTNSVLDIKGCRIYCTDGFIFDGGNYEVAANEIAKAINGFTLTTDKATNVNFGVNYFGTQVNYSYVIPAAAANNVVINYDKNRDASVNKWSIPSDANRVKIKMFCEPKATFSNATLNVSIYDTGTEFISVRSGSQTVNMPTPVPGTEFTFTHISPYPLVLVGTFITGVGNIASNNVQVADSLKVGQTITLEAYSNVGWKVKSITGDWKFEGVVPSFRFQAGEANAWVAFGFATSATDAVFRFETPSPSRPVSISTVDGFKVLRTATGSQVTGGGNKTPVLDTSKSSLCATYLTVSGMTGLTPGESLVLAGTFGTSSITVNY